MNDDIRTSLNQIVGDAMQDASPTEPLRRAAIERVRARRHRRPAVLVGAVLAGLTLTGTGAYAIYVATGTDDHVVTPDRIDLGLVPPTGEGTGTTEAPQDAAEESEPSQTTAPDALAPADPNAKFPQCGALVTSSAGSEQIRLWGPNRPPTAAGVELASVNLTDDWLSGNRSDATLALVRDGVVVGASIPAPSPVIPFEMGQYFPENLLDHSSSVLYSSCSQPNGTGVLPAGRYSIWGSQEFVITERAPVGVDGTHGFPVATHEEVTAHAQVADLWIDEDGQPVLTPDSGAGWPAPEDQVTAFAGKAEAPTVVWLASKVDAPAGALSEHQEQLLPLGYLEGTIPFRCQPDAPGQLGLADDGSGLGFGVGVGVIFASRAEADAFVALYEPLHGPVLKVVEGDMWCGE